jgi:hypothetical protein
MSEFQTDSPTSMDTNSSSDEIASLRQQVWTLLVILLVVSGTFCIYLVRQVSYAHKDLTVARQLVANGQGMDKLLQGLAEYSKTHPDFIPVLSKHGFTVNPTPATPPK